MINIAYTSVIIIYVIIILHLIITLITYNMLVRNEYRVYNKRCIPLLYIITVYILCILYTQLSRKSKANLKIFT